MKLKTILISIWVLIILPTLTYAIFVDTETSTGNTFTATTLNTQLTPSVPIEEDLEYDQDVSFTLTLQNIGQLNTQNSLFVIDVNNTTYAEKINVVATLDSTVELYNGRLDQFNVASNPYIVQNLSQLTSIVFTFSISEDDYNATPEQSVNFLIQNHAWQTNMPYGQGFFSNKYVDVTLTNPLTTD